jgi:magnesium transporter
MPRMRNRLLVPEILEALAEGRQADLVEVLGDLHPNDAASILSGLDETVIAKVMALLPIELARDVFAYFDPDVQESIVFGSGRVRLVDLLGALSSDDRAEFMERLDPRVREQMLPLLTKAVREDLIRRERYGDDEVGSIVSTEYSVLDKNLTTQQAIEEVRRQAPSKETIYYSYVVDKDGVLVGLVSLRNLLLAPPHRRIADVMVSDVVSVAATAPQAEAARLIREYDLLALPVTDASGRLIGIVTHDDAADILQEGAVDALEQMAGITAEDRPDTYLGASVRREFRRRVPVLTVLAGSFLFTGAVIGSFQSLFTASNGAPFVVMVLLPMIMATGGNVGNQASTAVILGLRNDLSPRAFTRVLWKELRVALCLAAVLSLIAGIQAFALLKTGDRHPLLVCAAVTLAMALHVTTAAMLGASIPLVFTALGRDPAMVAHPALATLADLIGAVIYFFTVRALVPMGG